MKEEMRNKLSLRLPINIDTSTKQLADYLGISQNALLIMLINKGLEGYDSKLWEQAE